MTQSVTVSELGQLMRLQGVDCVRAIHQQYGGTDALCHRLNTDPHHGLRSSLHHSAGHDMEICMGMGFPFHVGFSRESHGSGTKVCQKWEWEQEEYT